MREISGTDTITFSDFCNYVCTDIEATQEVTGDDKWIFLWDNLSSHLCALVYHTVEERNGPVQFQIVPRPPYQPKYGPSEYAFCEIIC